MQPVWAAGRDWMRPGRPPARPRDLRERDPEAHSPSIFPAYSSFPLQTFQTEP